MDKKLFERYFDGIVRYWKITKLANDNVKIGNLAADEMIYFLIVLINEGGIGLLKKRILVLDDRKLQQRLLISLTPFDLDFAKSTYKKYLDEKVHEYIENQPLAWNNFVDDIYLRSSRDLIDKVASKKKIKIDFNYANS